MQTEQQHLFDAEIHPVQELKRIEFTPRILKMGFLSTVLCKGLGPAEGHGGLQT